MAHEHHDEVWSCIKDIRTAMLTTVDADGTFTGRPMTTVQKQFDGTLWFFTSKTSPPAQDVLSKPSVGVQYVDHGKDLYVSLSGEASLDHDRNRIDGFWSPMVKAYFPDGKDDPDLVLLRIDVHKAEYWDVNESKPVQLFKMAKAIATGTRPTDLGEHGTVKV